MTLQPGQTIGRYQIIEPLGVGGMATVYKAFQPSLEREVALKVLRPGFSEDAEFFQRFQREARSIARLRHPNIVQVFDFEPVDGRYMLAMEFLEGGTLKERVTSLAQQGQRIPHPEVARIVGEVGSALGYGHERGVVHRDVKPSNVMLAEGGRAVVTDFGIAKIMGGEGQTQTGVGMGTPEYMAPEQGGGGAVDHRADIYSLGVMAYEMLTGRVPFTADTPIAIVLAHMRDPLPLPSSIDPSVPRAAEHVLMKALAKDPNDRYASATDFADALRVALTTAAVVAPVAPVTPRAAGTGIPRKALIGGAVLALLLLAGAGIAFSRGGSATSPAQVPQAQLTPGPNPGGPGIAVAGGAVNAPPLASVRGATIAALKLDGSGNEVTAAPDPESSTRVGGGAIEMTSPRGGQGATARFNVVQAVGGDRRYVAEMNVQFGAAAQMRFAYCFRQEGAQSYCLNLLSSNGVAEIRYIDGRSAPKVIGSAQLGDLRGRTIALAVVVDVQRFTVYVDERAVFVATDPSLTKGTAPQYIEVAQLGSNPGDVGTARVTNVRFSQLAGQ